jgi:hypothetical protein
MVLPQVTLSMSQVGHPELPQALSMILSMIARCSASDFAPRASGARILMRLKYKMCLPQDKNNISLTNTSAQYETSSWLPNHLIDFLTTSFNLTSFIPDTSIMKLFTSFLLAASASAAVITRQQTGNSGLQRRRQTLVLKEVGGIPGNECLTFRNNGTP